MLRRGDDRAVSALVGAVLLLGIFVVALSIYQLNVVPNENYEVEINHNERVQGELQDLRNTIVSVPGGNSGGSTTVTLGTTYSERTFTVNPPPASGTLRTEELGEIRIENATASGESDEVAAFWDEDWSRTTYGLTYTPDYNEYRNAPKTVYEHGFLYNHHSNGGSISVADQIVIDDDEITIVTLQGNLSESSSGSVSVDSRAFSTSSNTVSLESESEEQLTVTLPTSNPEHWNETLSDSVHDVTLVGDDRVRIELDESEEPYSFQMAEVGVGDANRASPADLAAYIHVVDPTEPTATVEVRDRLNNPVRNLEVDVNVDGTGDGQLSPTTGSNGQVRIDVDGGDTVTVSVPGTGDVDEVSFDVKSGSGEGDGESDSSYRIDWQDDQSDLDSCNIVDCDNDDADYRTFADPVTVEAQTDPEGIQGANVDFSLRDRNGIGASLTNQDPETNSDGIATVDIETDGSDGLVDTYVASGGTSDVTTIEFASGGFIIQEIQDNSPVEQGDTLEVDVTVENTDSETATQDVDLYFDGEVVDTLEYDLDAGESEENTFEYKLEDEEPGTYEIEVRTEDDSVTSEIDVIEEDAPFFDVTIINTNDPIDEGETLTVDAEIENTGEDEATQDITLEMDGDQKDSEEITVESGETGTVELEWETGEGDAGEYTAIVSSDDDEDDVQVIVEDVGQPPVIDSLNVTPDGGNDYEIEWNVSDPDGDLSQVEIELFKGNGDLGDSETEPVSGESADGVNTLSTGNADEVQLTVTDEKGNQATATESV